MVGLCCLFYLQMLQSVVSLNYVLHLYSYTKVQMGREVFTGVLTSHDSIY